MLGTFILDLLVVGHTYPDSDLEWIRHCYRVLHLIQYPGIFDENYFNKHLQYYHRQSGTAIVGLTAPASIGSNWQWTPTAGVADATNPNTTIAAVNTQAYRLNDDTGNRL